MEMDKVARFYKVSLQEFVSGGGREEDYEAIKLPIRATRGSAGYDIATPRDITLAPSQTVKIATGLKVKIREGYFLAVFPRSSLGFKFQLSLCNTIGVVDSDYFGNPSNDGHIFIKLVNYGEKVVSILSGEAVAQGVLMSFGITEDDNVETTRIGGFGSTDTNKAK
ncbi:MAG: deoxyuridine 5'-triphosphate nucleotidohydrolase [Clostridia bacterium]